VTEHRIWLPDTQFEPLTDHGGPVTCSCGWAQLGPESEQEREAAEAFGRVSGLLIAAILHLQREMVVAHLPADAPAHLERFPEGVTQS
jgi:hypothetical protein